MKVLKRTLLRIGFYYLLLLINCVLSLSFISNTFPLRNLPSIFLLILSFCLVLYYSHRVSPKGMSSFFIKSIAWLSLLLILFRSIKYSSFSRVDILARHTWYFYYIPILLMPLCLFYISILVSNKRGDVFPKAFIWVFIITIIFIVLILTNDLHQQVFKFQEGFKDWNSDYEHVWLFYVINVWQYSLYLAAIVILIVKCRISESKKNAWVLLIPASIGVVLYILLLINRVPHVFGSTLFEFPEAHIFTIVTIVECCIQLGLVPTNSEYGKIFQNLSINSQITDEKGNPLFISKQATPITKEQFSLPNGSRVDEHSLLHKMKLPGGYGFWQDDMKELDRINEELIEAKEALKQETELIRLRNELDEKQAKIKQRIILYDKIAESTHKQSQTISALAKKARETKDKHLKDEYCRRIVLFGAYIKRYANLILLSQENNVIELGELKLSISELLHYLNYYGVPGEFIGEAQSYISSRSALCVFSSLQLMIEDNIKTLKGVFVSLDMKDKVVLKLILENMRISLSKDKIKELSDNDIIVDITKEDMISYITFNLNKEEKTL